MENKKLMAMARESLSGKWGLTVGTFLVFWLIMVAAKSNGVAVLLIGGKIGSCDLWGAWVFRQVNGYLRKG